MKLDIIQEPDARLHQRAEEMRQVHAAHQVIGDLIDTFWAANDCIGLAAPQIGHPYRVIIVDVTERHTDTYLMVNPVITKESEDQQRVLDGCMSVSFGKKHLQTRRPKRITVSWVDRDGLRRAQKFSGIMAACIHHEIDHLNGVLFMDRCLRIDHAVL